MMFGVIVVVENLMSYFNFDYLQVCVPLSFTLLHPCTFSLTHCMIVTAGCMIVFKHMIQFR